MSGFLKNLSAFVAVVITIGYVWQTNRPVRPDETTWEDVLAEAEVGGYRIISTEALAERYNRDASGLLLIDTRQAWEYRMGHIKDALNFPMEPNWWSRWRKSGALEDFLGPDKNRLVVFY